MKRIVLLSILLMFISCGNSDETDELIGLNFDKETFEKNRKLWSGKGILNYTFSQKYFSESVGSQPKITCVVKKSVFDSASVKSENNNTNVISIKSLTYYKTIEDVFNFIEYTVNNCQKEIVSDKSPMKGASIDVEYDNNYYYPIKINCSGYYPSGFVGGLSIQIILNNFDINK